LDDFNKSLQTITGLQNVYRDATDKISKFGLGNIRHMIENSGDGQIDTGLMMHSLIAFTKNLGIEILNGIQVNSIKAENNSVTLISENCDKIEANAVIITTNGFARQFLPNLEVEPARAQVLVTKPVEGLQLKGSFHYDHGYYYFRNIGNRILFGGARNLDFEEENTMDFSLTSKIQNRLDELLTTMIAPGRNPEVEMRWSGIMGIGPKKSPIVEKVSERIYCAVRMGGMGVALGSLVGEDAAKMVLTEL
jgi:glycine/D-amino acid oxidase-like deaminating enzyme